MFWLETDRREIIPDVMLRCGGKEQHVVSRTNLAL